MFTSVLLAACSLTLEPPESTAAATVTVANAQDQVTVFWEGERLIVDVESPGGIGQAAVELAGEPLPSSIVLRFHLAGLEHLEFTYAATTITVSLLSTGEHRVVEHVVGPGQSTPEPLTPDSVYWMEVTVSPSDALSDQRSSVQRTTPTVIEVAVPADFFQGESRSFSLAWIDFYR